MAKVSVYIQDIGEYVTVDNQRALKALIAYYEKNRDRAEYIKPTVRYARFSTICNCYFFVIINEWDKERYCAHERTRWAVDA